MPAFAASLIIPVLTGFIFVYLLWPCRLSAASSIIFRIFLGLGFGIGLLSLFYFVWGFIFRFHSGAYLLVELGFLVCLIITAFFLRNPKRQALFLVDEDRTFPITNLQRVLAIVFCLAAALAVSNEILLILCSPHGGWDAWAVWNHHAIVMLKCRDCFLNNLPLLSNGDYPLLLPGFIARCWSYIGSEVSIVPALVGALFGLATIGLMMSCLSILRNRTQSLLAGISLAGSWLFLRLSSYQYADIPLGFFFLTALALICMKDKLSTNNGALLFLAGLTSGLAAWTKNEGCLFLVSFIVAGFIVTPIFNGWKGIPKQTAWFALGAIPVLTMVLYFKIEFAPANDMISATQFPVTERQLFNFPKYLTILKSFIKEVFIFHRWGYIAPLLIIYFFYLIFTGLGIPRDNRAGIATAALTIGFMVIGYFFVYAVTPWHMSTSLNRLFMQLWPSVIFIYFLAVPVSEGHAN